MQTQPTLWDSLPPIIPIRGDRFSEFHAANPNVYIVIKRIALDLKRRGFRKAGMKAIFEQIRWRYALQTRGEAYELNNNYTSHYSRLLMQQEPGLAGFFETRGE